MAFGIDRLFSWRLGWFGFLVGFWDCSNFQFALWNFYGFSVCFLDFSGFQLALGIVQVFQLAFGNFYVSLQRLLHLRGGTSQH